LDGDIDEEEDRGGTVNADVEVTEAVEELGISTPLMR
jgi:hypothetical protein